MGQRECGVEGEGKKKREDGEEEGAEEGAKANENATSMLWDRISSIGEKRYNKRHYQT